MILFNRFSGTYIILLVLWGSGSSQNLQAGVDLVTNLSNSIMPTLLRGLSGTNENVVVGPFGLLSNLAMILEASDGKTRQEILRSLKISNDHVQDLRTGFKAYCDQFSDHASETEAAGSFNSASIGASFNLAKDYRLSVTRNFCANVTSARGRDTSDNILDFRSDSGVMSHWRDYEKLAVYTFLSHESVMPFTKSDNVNVSVPMIPQVGVFRSARWEKSQIVLLPLQARLVHLLLVIPDGPTKFDTLLTKLVNYNLAHFIESMPKDEMEVFIPQMTAVNKDMNLTDILIRSGIRDVFDPEKVNLTRATADNSTRIHVGDITQSAYFSTSFVALNSVSGTSTSLRTGKSRRRRDANKIYVNKPFAFLLLHKNTQLVLLAGKIGNPVQVPT